MRELLKTAFVVLGMHRSGTSSVAGTLARLGPKAPLTLLDASEDNPRGFWESRLVVAQNDEILQAGGSYWRDWQAFHPERIDPVRTREIQEDISRLLNSEFNNENEIVLKDPRLCRLFTYWDKPLTSAGYRSVFILPIRSPFEVAASLMRRNGLSKAECMLLWLRHVLEAEYQTRGRPRKLILWNNFMADWRVALHEIAEAVNWVLPDVEGQNGADIDAFLSADLKHQHHDDADLSRDPESHVWLNETWPALNALVLNQAGPEALATLDRVRQLMDVSSDIYGRAFGPVLWEAHEANTRCDHLAAELSALAQKVSYLAAQDLRHHDVIHKRDIRIAELNEQSAIHAHRAERMETTAFDAAAQLAACEDRAADLENLRDRQSSHIAILEKRGAELQRLVETRANELETLQARLSAESDALSALKADLRMKPLTTVWRLRK